MDENELNEILNEADKVLNESINLGDFPDRFLLLFDKPLAKLTNRNIHLFHGSPFKISDSKLTPMGINVGATKFSSMRWSNFFWDNKEAAIMWGMTWAIFKADRNVNCLFINGKNKPVMSISGYNSIEEIKKYVCSLNVLSYVYECIVPAREISVGSNPSIKEYTVSRNVDIYKKYVIKLNKSLLDKYFDVMLFDNFMEKFNEFRKLDSKKFERNFILNKILRIERDANKAIIRKQKPGLGDDLNKYRDLHKLAMEKDIFNIRENYNEIIIDDHTMDGDLF